jgi:hypothetical protein
MIIKPKRIEQSNHSLDSVSLARVKEQLRILDSDEDALIQSYINAATLSMEGWTGYDILTADYINYYDLPCCQTCCQVYQISGRPFDTVTAVEVLQDGVMTALTTAEYTVSVEQWRTLVDIDGDVVIDDGEDDIDQIKISYGTGKYNTIALTQIETTTVGTPNIATVTLPSAHNMKTNDQTIISGSGTTEYDGTFTVTVTSAVAFTYEYLGSDPGISVIGNCIIPLVPRDLELAIMQMVASMYENRGDCSDSCGEVPCMSQKLARRYRQYIVRSAGASCDCTCR